MRSRSDTLLARNHATMNSFVARKSVKKSKAPKGVGSHGLSARE